jgi:hypothetical protein
VETTTVAAVVDGHDDEELSRQNWTDRLTFLFPFSFEVYHKSSPSGNTPSAVAFTATAAACSPSRSDYLWRTETSSFLQELSW